MSGHVGDLSAEQEEILKRFQEAVSDVLEPHHDDYFLLRWLRARCFDAAKAEVMLRKHMEWRKEFNADTLVTSYNVPEVFERYFPSGFLGFDKEGYPLRIIQFGNLDFEGAVNSLRTKDIIKCIATIFEEDIRIMEEQSKKLGKVIETHVYIADVKEVPMKLVFNRAVGEIILNVVMTYQENYPERLKRVYVINVNAAFNAAFKLVKKFLCPEVLNKYRMYGTEGWREALLKDIDADVLPAFLGGTRVDPDGNPLCLSVVNPGGIIPTDYYMKNTRLKFCDRQTLKRLVVDKKDFALVDVSVEDPGTTLTWQFLSMDHDIGFGLFYRGPDSEKGLEEIMPIHRVECHLLPENGFHECTKAGIYVLQFDNSYSFLRHKELLYHVDKKTPFEAVGDFDKDP